MYINIIIKKLLFLLKIIITHVNTIFLILIL